VKVSSITIDTHKWIDKRELGPVLKVLESALSVSSRYDPEVSIPTYIETDTQIGLPRYFLTPLIQPEKLYDRTTSGCKLKMVVKTDYQQGQKNLISELESNLKQKKTGFIISAETGTGKTYLALRCIEAIGRKALVVVPRSNLLEQWRNEIILHTDIAPERIGTGQLGEIEWRDKDIVIALVHTLALDREPLIFKQQFGVVIFDEVDRSVPPASFSTVASMFPAKYRIGFSATTSRKDGLHVINDWHVGETTLYMGKGKKMPSKVVVIPYTNKFAAEPPSHLATMVKRGIVLGQIEKDQSRSVYICKFIKKLYLDPERRILVLSDRTKQLLDLAKILETNDVPKGDIGFYCQSLRFPGVDKTGKKRDVVKSVPQSERDRAAAKCKIILATYGMVSIGTNIPDLSVLVFATPQSNAKQSLGRVERYLEGKKQPLVLDILDESYEQCSFWFKAREKEYKQMGLTVSIYTPKQ